jgi:hypothetical protein
MVERLTARRRLSPSRSLLPSPSEHAASNATASRRSLTSRSALNCTTQRASEPLSLSSTSNTHTRLLSTVADCIVLGSQLPDPILPYDINSLFWLEPVGGGTHLAASYCIGTDEGNTPDIFVPSRRFTSLGVQDENPMPQQMRLLSALGRIDNDLPFPPHDTSIVWPQHLTVSHRRVLIPLFLSASQWLIIDVKAPDHVTLYHSKLSQDMIYKAEELHKSTVVGVEAAYYDRVLPCGVQSARTERATTTCRRAWSVRMRRSCDCSAARKTAVYLRLAFSRCNPSGLRDFIAPQSPAGEQLTIDRRTYDATQLHPSIPSQTQGCPNDIALD